MIILQTYDLLLNCKLEIIITDINYKYFSFLLKLYDLCFIACIHHHNKQYYLLLRKTSIKSNYLRHSLVFEFHNHFFLIYIHCYCFSLFKIKVNLIINLSVSLFTLSNISTIRPFICTIFNQALLADCRDA